EAVSFQGAPGELAGVGVCFDHFESLAPDGSPPLQSDSRLRHGKPLKRDGAPVLESCVSDIQSSATAHTGQFACDPLGVCIALANLEEHVLSGACGRKSELLLDQEVIRLRAENAESDRRTVSSRRIERDPKHQPAAPPPGRRVPRSYREN